MRRAGAARLPRLAGALFWVVLGVPATAAADDYLFDSDTSFQAYEVRSPGTAAFLARRRLIQTLGFTWARELADREDGEVTPRVAAGVRLRLDQDFSRTCLTTRDLCIRSTEPTAASTYVPLASDTDVDAPEAWVELRGLPARTRLRAGRHLFWGPAGILRLDGATATSSPSPFLSLQAFGGAVVKETSLVATGTFQPQGVLRLDLPDEVSPSRVPYVDEPTTTWAAGGALALGHEKYVRLRASFRELFEEEGRVARQGALSIASQPSDALRLSASGALDLIDGTLFDAAAELQLTPIPLLSLRLRSERHVPRFDWGSIWAYFDLVPVTEGSGYFTLRPVDDFEVGFGVRGRAADFGPPDDDPEGEGYTEGDVGYEAHLRARVAGFRVALYGTSWGGDLGPVASVLLNVSRKLTWWAALDFRTSLWHFDDPLRQGMYGLSVAEAVGVRLRLGAPTSVRVDLEHSYNAIVGNRFRFVAHLSIEVWK